MNPFAIPAHISDNNPTMDRHLTTLADAVTTELRATMNRLASQDVPPTISAVCMMRLAATVIRDTAGRKELELLLHETHADLIGPRD